MKDKRLECRCHIGCTVLPHECPEGVKKCVWPNCLTDEEHEELAKELLEEEL